MSCENLLQFDVTAVSVDYASSFAVFRIINEQNYDSMKQKFSANVPDYFDGNYESFSRKRSELNKLFAQSGTTEIHKSYFTRSLSPEGARAYAECVARQSEKPIAAWIEAITDSKIIVALQCGLSGNVDVSYSVVGPQPEPANTSTGVLTSGSRVPLMFSYNPAVDFVVAFSVKVSQTSAQDMVVVELPKRRRFEQKTRTIELTGYAKAGAGGNGSTVANPLWEDLELVAPPGYYLLPETRRVTRNEIIGGPGLSQYHLTWREEKNNEEKVVKLTAHPEGMNGGAHTQGIINIHISVLAEQPYLQEIIGLA